MAFPFCKWSRRKKRVKNNHRQNPAPTSFPYFSISQNQPDVPNLHQGIKYSLMSLEIALGNMQQRTDATVSRSQTIARWAHALKQMFAGSDIGSIFGECVHADALRARWRRKTCPWQHAKGKIYISIGDFFFKFNLWRGAKVWFNFMEWQVPAFSLK